MRRKPKPEAVAVGAIIRAEREDLSVDHFDLGPAVDRAKALVENAFSKNTKRAYKASWVVFERWCVKRNLLPLPATPQIVALYVSEMASGEVEGASKKGSLEEQPKKKRRPSTISGHLASIHHHHTLAGLDSPTDAPEVNLMMESARRTYGTQKDKKSPILAEMIPSVIDVIDSDPDLSEMAKARNKGLVLLGFAGAFRRSELVHELCIVDFVEKKEGLLVHLRHSKTDQTGIGRYIRIPYGSSQKTCPVIAILSLRQKLADRGITSGSMFLSESRNNYGKPINTNSVALIIKAAIKAAGYDPAVYAGHSLRAGFVTSAAQRNATLPSIMEQTGHTDLRTLSEYIRVEGSWDAHAGKGLL